MRPFNKRNTWIVVDSKGKIYEKSRTKAFLIFHIKRLKSEHHRTDLVIEKADEQGQKY